VVYALTRKSLSKSLKRSAKTSVAAILNYDGASTLYAKLEALVTDARRDYARRAGPWIRITQAANGGAAGSGGLAQPTGQPQERFLVPYVRDGKQVAVDPLVLRPGLDRAPGDDDAGEEDDPSRWMEPPAPPPPVDEAGAGHHKR
jgi:hypothetical protein